MRPIHNGPPLPGDWLNFRGLAPFQKGATPLTETVPVPGSGNGNSPHYAEMMTVPSQWHLSPFAMFRQNGV